VRRARVDYARYARLSSASEADTVICKCARFVCRGFGERRVRGSGLDRGGHHIVHGVRCPGRDRGGSRWCVVVHAGQLDRTDYHERVGDDLPRPGHRGRSRNHGGTGRRPMVHRLGQRQQWRDRADHNKRGGHELHRPWHQAARIDRGRTRRRAVVHQYRLWDQLDRTGHDGRNGNDLHRPDHRLALWITAGSDGALWFTNFGSSSVPSSIGRITTNGAVSNFTAPTITGPQGIAAGPDGALWFVDTGGLGSIGRITTSGIVTNYTDPKMSIAGPKSIAAGPDGALWFTNQASSNFGGNSIGRITTSGAITSYTAAGLDGPYEITAGPDGAMWFTDFANHSIGRITVSARPRAKDDCKNGGWRTLTDDHGQPFRNQGQCIAFVNHE
jgi:hypothetical protein